MHARHQHVQHFKLFCMDARQHLHARRLDGVGILGLYVNPCETPDGHDSNHCCASLAVGIHARHQHLHKRRLNRCDLDLEAGPRPSFGQVYLRPMATIQIKKKRPYALCTVHEGSSPFLTCGQMANHSIQIPGPNPQVQCTVRVLLKDRDGYQARNTCMPKNRTY